MHRFAILFVLTVLFCAVGSVYSATIHVPSQQPTIQAGINAAVNGDTVLVAPGVYSGPGNTNLSTLGKQIRLLSTHGPDSTTILLPHLGEEDERGFDFSVGEDSNTVIMGFHISSPDRAWSVTPGGAIKLTNSSPQIVNCRISQQLNLSGPGAVLAQYSNAIFQNCEFLGNVAGNSAWLARQAETSPAVGGSGGAVNAQSSDLIFRNCRFQGNVSDEGSGGAIRAQDSWLQFDSCEFNGNIASGHDNHGEGGAVHGDGSYRDCKFMHNDAMWSGGAVSGSASFERCLFVGNYTGYRNTEGGGAFFGQGTVSYCTFVANGADLGSAIFSSGGVVINNSLFFGNIDKDNEAYPERLDPCIVGLATVSCTDVFGNSTGNWIGDLSGSEGTNENFSANPRFCDSASGDFSVSNTSPCAPANNSCGMLIGALPVGCIDNPIYVPTQFSTIQAAIDAASSGDTVYIGAGVYSGPGNVDLNPGGKSLTLIGAGRDSTIIDCSNDGQNHRGIWMRNGEVAFKLTSLSIRNGVPPLVPAGAGGATILVESETQLTVENCVLSCESGGSVSLPYYGSFECSNSSVEGGGGIGIFANPRSILLNSVRITNSSIGLNCSAETLQISNCQFVSNELGVDIGGSRPTIAGCRFDSNATFGARFGSSVPLVSACTFSHNGASGIYLWQSGYGLMISGSTFTGNGGGILVEADSDGLGTIGIKNSVFIANSGQFGGAIGCTYDFVTLDVDSCTFFGNSSPRGCVLYSWDRATFNVRRSVLSFNSGSAPFVAVNPEATISLSCSNIFGNSGGDWVGDIADQFGVNGNISANPLFCDTASGDFHIAAESPCAPANNSCNQQIGAFGVACSVKPGVTAVLMENEALSNVLSPTPKFQWAVNQPVPSPQDSFVIAVGTDNDWQFAEKWNPAPFATSDTFVTYDGSALLDGQTYYLRLRVHNTLAWSDWYQTSFRMNSVPTSPVLRAPTNLAVVGSLPTLWLTNGTDAESDPLTYEFAGFHDTDCVSGPSIDLIGVASGVDSTDGQIVDPLAENCRYFWRARAFDGYEYSDWTSYAQFMVNGSPEAPSAPMLDYPPLTDNKPIFTLLPTLDWQTSHDPDPGDTVRYKLELSDRANFSFALVRDSLLSTDLPLVDSLVFGTHYYWRVTARDKTGLSAMSGVKEFWTWKLGDMNHSHSTDLSDLSLLIAYLVQTPRPDITPKMLADLTGDCKIDLSDLSTMIAFMTSSGVVLNVGCE